MIAGLLSLLIRLVCGPTVRYLHPIEGTQPRIFFANHSSHLDFLVIWATLPGAVRRLTRPVAARDYWSQGRIRRFLAGTLFGGLMIERNRPTTEDNPVEQMVSVLDQRQSLILFPEGTRGTGETIAPFRTGLYHLHRSRPDVELVPVHLENLNRILPKGEFLPVPLLSYVTFGAPLPNAEHETRDEFLERGRQALLALEAS
jgi:1-acyl-sn-glycerol-3-phosphate acyltransferase